MFPKRGFFRFVAVGSRIFLGLLFVTGGFSKLLPFPGVMGPVWLEAELQPYGLGLYARFIAWSEAIIGLLLLSRRFTALGAVMLVPLVVNILMVTISMQWRGTPYVVSFFLILNLYLLAYDYDRWKFLLVPPRSEILSASAAVPAVTLIDIAGVTLCLAGPLFYLMHAVLAYVSMSAGFLLLLVAAFRRSSAEQIEGQKNPLPSA